MNKNLHFTLFLMFGLFISSYAQTVTIGTGTEVNKSIPIEPYFGYSYSQNIYLSSEIGQTGNIYTITFKTKPGIATTKSEEWKIYMGHTTKSAFDNNTDWIAASNMTEVFNGNISILENEVEVTLSTPFNYDGTSNLVIAVDENEAGYDETSDDYYASSVTGNRSIYYRSDSTNPDPASPPQASNTQAFVSNVELNFTQITCPKPNIDNSTITEITRTGAKANWAAGGTETSWNLELVNISAGNSATGTATQTNLTSQSYTLTGLTANTEYSVYAQAVCSANDLSEWALVGNFSTLCNALTAEHIYGFDGASLDNCWSTKIENSESSSSIMHLSTFVKYEGDRALRIANFADKTGAYYVITPEFSDITTSKQMSFFLRKNITTDSDGDIVQFGYFANGSDTSTFNTIQDISLASLTEDQWTEVIISLSSVSVNNVRFALKIQPKKEYNYWYVDSFSYKEAPTCLTPTFLTASDIAANSAKLSWTARGSETSWDIELVDVSSGNNPTGQPTQTGVSNPYILTGLVPNNNYKVYVRASCGNNDFSEYAPMSFKTLCATTNSNYTYNFPTSTISSCWREAEGILANGPLGTTSIWTKDTLANDSSTNAFRFNYYGSNSNGWLITPMFDLSMLNKLEFDMAATNWGATSLTKEMLPGDKFHVLINTGNGWTPLETMDENFGWSASPITKTYDLTQYDGEAQFAFLAKESANGNTTRDIEVSIANFSVSIDNTLSIESQELSRNKFVLYPNPAKDYITIKFDKEILSVELYDLGGKMLFNNKIENNQFNISNLSTGIYIAKFITIDNQVVVKRIIKQ